MACLTKQQLADALIKLAQLPPGIYFSLEKLAQMGIAPGIGQTQTSSNGSITLPPGFTGVIKVKLNNHRKAAQAEEPEEPKRPWRGSLADHPDVAKRLKQLEEERRNRFSQGGSDAEESSKESDKASYEWAVL